MRGKIPFDPHILINTDSHRRKNDTEFQIGFCYNNRQTKRGQINTDEQTHRSENSHHLKQASDHKKPHPDRIHGYGKGTDSLP